MTHAEFDTMSTVPGLYHPVHQFESAASGSDLDISRIFSQPKSTLQLVPILSEAGVIESDASAQPVELIVHREAEPPWSSARSLLKYAGTWAGQDLGQCLEEVYTYRGEAEF